MRPKFTVERVGKRVFGGAGEGLRGVGDGKRGGGGGDSRNRHTAESYVHS